jgi:predicted TIM-barrel fold metal-dependent hydrolase
LVDAHIHLFDFMHETDGAAALIAAMDAAGVERAVVFGMPVKKKWDVAEPDRPGYYMDDVARCYYFSLTDLLVLEQLDRLPERDRARIAPMACGFDPTDLSAVTQLERLFDHHPPGTWRGVGEVLLRHGDLSARLVGELPRANHAGMRRIADFCAERQVPLVVHSNASGQGHAPEAYVAELEALLQLYEGETLVWCHAGISEIHSEHDHVPTVTRLLAENEALHVDLSWAAVDDVLDASDEPFPQWLELIERFPDRVMLGSDVLGHFEVYDEIFGRTARILDGLSADTRKKVAHGNAERLWFGDPAR